MRKVIISFIILVSLLVVVGFKTNNGNYKKGTYYGYAIDISDVLENEAKAIIYIGNNGMIESVSLDATYPIQNKNLEQNWYEQIEMLENKIIREQKISDKEKDNILYTALEEALNKAKN